MLVDFILMYVLTFLLKPIFTKLDNSLCSKSNPFLGMCHSFMIKRATQNGSKMPLYVYIYIYIDKENIVYTKF